MNNKKLSVKSNHINVILTLSRTGEEEQDLNCVIKRGV